MTNTDFADLKRNSKKSLSEYQEEVNKTKTVYENDDDRFWVLTKDKAGNGRAIIRFLPPSKGEKKFFIKYFSHGFSDGSNNWYIENCPTSLGEGHDCPACEANSKLWKESGDNEKHPNREIVRKRKRRLHYVSNILVIKDFANPDNNGKVFLFKYGKRIFEKIDLALNPKFEGDEPINPFDLWEGFNFDLRQRIVDDYPNFSDSKFESEATPVAEKDKKIEEIWLSQHLLLPFIAEDKFKSYDELKKKLNRVLGVTETASVRKASSTKDDDGTETAPKVKEKSTKSRSPEDFFSELNDEDDPF